MPIYNVWHDYDPTEKTGKLCYQYCSEQSILPIRDVLNDHNKSFKGTHKVGGLVPKAENQLHRFGQDVRGNNGYKNDHCPSGGTIDYVGKERQRGHPHGR